MTPPLHLHAPAHSRVSRRPLLLATLGLVLTTQAFAQGPVVIASTSADAAVDGVSLPDESLLAHEVGLPARMALPAMGVSVFAAEGSSGLHPTFGDVDAVHLASGASVDAGLYLSLVSDEAGFLDGDVLLATPDGYQVVVEEAQLLAVTGATVGNLDLDALYIDPDGSLVFSLAENEDSSLLSGDTAGVIGDGDILHLAPGATEATMHFTEDMVSAMVSLALGSSQSIGDVKGLAKDPLEGSLLFTVQSPSAHDASVFTMSGGGAVLAGHSEADFGFEGATELDALTISDQGWPGLDVSNPYPAAGEAVEFVLRDAQASVVHVLLASLDVAPAWVQTQGWGGLVLENDVALGATLAALPALTMVPGLDGVATLPLVVPGAAVPVDLVFQVVSLGPGRVTSNPVLVEALQ